MTKAVAILGCGPSGLMAAHAAELSGWDFRIYSRLAPSRLYGAQYLKKPIPQVTAESHMISYTLIGEPEQYIYKVYGRQWDLTLSREYYEVPHEGWDIRGTYDRLWKLYKGSIVNTEITKDFRPSGCDLVMSTVPRTLWATHPQETFKFKYIWALGDTEISRVKEYRPPPFEVVDNANPPRTSWHRVSNIFGHCTMEWPYIYSRPPTPGCSRVIKPESHNCQSASDFIHLGRYGAWRKGVRSHDSFFDAMEALNNDRIEANAG